MPVTGLVSCSAQSFRRHSPLAAPWLAAVLLLAAVSTWSQLALAQSSGDTAFVRFVDGERAWQGALQTAITTYEHPSGKQLDLVAAVHIAEPEYYQQLNEYFTALDAVLYELVAEPDQRPTPDTAAASPLSFIQRAMAGFLDVSFQLEHVDYLAENFIHADLSPAELDAIMAAKNESFFTMFLSLAMAEMANEQAAREAGQMSTSAFTYFSLMNAMAAEDRGQAFKYLFASELGRADTLLAQPEAEESLTILGDRNKAALRVLEQTLNDSAAEHLAIFYGAAHMSGLERVITQEMGFKRTGTKWLDAWTIP